MTKQNAKGLILFTLLVLSALAVGTCGGTGSSNSGGSGNSDSGGGQGSSATVWDAYNWDEGTWN